MLPYSGVRALLYRMLACRQQTPAAMKLRLLLFGLLAISAIAKADEAIAPPGARALAFRIDEGRNINSFLREGPVAAHLLLRSGTEPRILVAFPAGNSGVGLWFEKTSATGRLDAGFATQADHGARRKAPAIARHRVRDRGRRARVAAARRRALVGPRVA